MAPSGISISANKSVGARTVIEGSSVEHSVILENCHISGLERLADSIIARNAEVIRHENSFKTVRLFVGDDAKIELSLKMSQGRKSNEGVSFGRCSDISY